MAHVIPMFVLGACCLAGLVLVPLGLPGLWVMVLGVIASAWLTGFRTAGAGTIAVVVGLALLGEVVEWWLSFRFAQRYGGSRRGAWGALLGGLIGAGVGVPLPVVGSVLGAFVGSFAGAVLCEYLGEGRAESVVRAAWGALLGRAAGTAAKVGLGLVIAVLGAFAALRR